jgi:uncharacterized membrane protein
LVEVLFESLSLLLRWLHVVAAIAWIGESFYFVALDRGLKPPQSPEQGMAGESWSVHGGGFYRKQKFVPAPAALPTDLLWSKWKAYTTWLSGMALFAVLYLRHPAIALIDPAVAALTPTQAVAIALALPVVGWIAYDLLCRAFAGEDDAHGGTLGALVALFVVALCAATTQLFAGRAAFLVAGAVLGTLMAANVFFVIIPGQKRLVAALAAGTPIDPRDGARGKQRSVHNTYFTLPVVFAMLATHEPAAFAHAHAWAVLAGFMLAGALVRHFFVRWHDGGREWWLLGVAAVVLVALLAWIAPSAPSPTPTPATASTPDTPDALAMPTLTATQQAALAVPVPETAAVLPLLALRCGGCHSAQPSLIATPPKGVAYDTAAEAEKHAAAILRQAVQLKVMPPGNMTGLTDDERAALGRWAAAHAPR